MAKTRLMILTGAALLFLLTLAACSAAAAQTAANPAATAPAGADMLATAQAQATLPTAMAGQGIRSGSAPVCLVKEDASITTDTKQGDLLAWSPVSNALAYVRPSNGRWAWYVGDLVVYDLGLSKEVYASKNLEVFGDLTWAPDANALAYVVLDQSQKLYTVHVLSMAGGTDTNIFSGSSARTDEWSSTKGITDWESPRNVVVTSSCGSDCARIYNYNTDSGVMTINGDERKVEDPSLDLTNGMTSPDSRWELSTDTHGNLWLADTKTGKASILVAGTEVSEMKWSIDSKYLAIRTAEKVQVYQVNCKP